MAKHKKPKGTANETTTTTPKDTSPRVFQRDKITYDLNIRQRDDLTEKQKQLIELILDKKTKLVLLDGPAGTSKTFIAVLCGLMLLQKRALSDILYVRSIAESASKSLGALPGDTLQKISPFLMPLLEKLDELLPKAEADKLIKEERASGVPINYLRGASFNARFIIADEVQNLSVKEGTTLITRIGEYSKMILCGDHLQSDINGASCFMKFYDLFNDEESRNNGIHCFSFTKDDIVRSGILRYIVERLERPPGHTEPMFPVPAK